MKEREENDGAWLSHCQKRFVALALAQDIEQIGESRFVLGGGAGFALEAPALTRPLTSALQLQSPVQGVELYPHGRGALAALELIQHSESQRQRLLERAERWRSALEAAGWPRPAGFGPVLSLLVGDDQRALDLQQQLEAQGLLSVAIRPPTVPSGTARLRLVLRQDLPEGSLDLLLRALGSA